MPRHDPKAAARSAASRKQQLAAGGRHINTVISADAARALAKRMRDTGATMRAVIENCLMEWL